MPDEVSQRGISMASLAWVFLAALAVRAVYASMMIAIAGDAGVMMGDSGHYQRVTRNFVDGLAAGTVTGWELLGPEPHRMPIPQWLMAMTTLAFGDGGVRAFVFLQGAIDALTCVVIARLAATLRPNLFYPAAILAALNPTMIAISGRYLTDTVFVLFVALLALGMCRWMRDGGWRNAALIGFGLGLACLCRTLAVAFIPVMVAVMAAMALVDRPAAGRRLAQAVVAGVLAATCFSPIMARNIAVYDAWSVTPQSGKHMLYWHVPLVRERVDGTAYADTVEQLREEFGARHPDLENPFSVSAAMGAMAMEKLAAFGPEAIVRAWLIGAVVNMAAPAATMVPMVRAQPYRGFYATAGETFAEKVYYFLFVGGNVIYTSIVGIGTLGVGLARLGQLRGLWLWMLTPGARAFLVFSVLWVGFVLAVNGPVATPKYRLPMEPVLVVALAFGITGRRRAQLGLNQVHSQRERNS